MIAVGFPACVRKTDPLQKLYEDLFYRMTFEAMPSDELIALLADKTCHGVFLPAIEYYIWQHDDATAACEFTNEATVNPAVPAFAGWVTNRHSACVQYTIEVGMQEAVEDGLLGALFRRSLTSKPCEMEVEEATSPPAVFNASKTRRRRRLTRASSMSSRQRRLAVGSGGAAAGASVDRGHGDSGEEVLTFVEFVGLFAIWGAGSVIALACTAVQSWRRHGSLQRTAVAIRQHAKASVSNTIAGRRSSTSEALTAMNMEHLSSSIVQVKDELAELSRSLETSQMISRMGEATQERTAVAQSVGVPNGHMPEPAPSIPEVTEDEAADNQYVTANYLTHSIWDQSI